MNLIESSIKSVLFYPTSSLNFLINLSTPLLYPNLIFSHHKLIDASCKDTKFWNQTHTTICIDEKSFKNYLPFACNCNDIRLCSSHKHETRKKKHERPCKYATLPTLGSNNYPENMFFSFEKYENFK